jgi:TolB-like protein/DNA-binding winged helix-turn-helix (wHTH) protein/tetratricopeptide (TPR) repeat protein
MPSQPSPFSSERPPIYRFENFTLDLARGCLFSSEAEVKLRPKTFEALRYVVENAGRLVPKEELVRAVWPDSFVSDNSLAQCFLEIRKALEDDDQRIIKTVPRRGYVFDVPVEKGPAHLTQIVPSGPERAAGADRAARIRLSKWVGWAATALTVAAIWVWILGRARSPRPAQPAVAVLPFQSLAGSESDEFLELGMADALIAKLSNVNEIAVRPTSAVRAYTDRKRDLVQIAKQLRVGYVVEGSLQKKEGRIAVTVQLIGVPEGRPLWAERYQDASGDIFTLQDAISTRVAAALAPKLTGEESRRLKKNSTSDMEAFQLYLRGRYVWEQRTDAGLRRAIAYFEQAIRRDPQFALAYAGLAECYGPLMQLSFMPAIEALPKIEEAASRAVELDDTLAEAHTALAGARMNEWDWPSAEREFKRAIALNPNEVMAHRWYGYYLDAMGRKTESLNEWKRGYELDPSSPGGSAWLGWALFRAGRSQEAMPLLQEAIELNPDFPQAHERLGYVYVELRSFDQALEQFSRPEELIKRMYVLARAGHGVTAQRELEQFLKLPPSQRPGAEMEIAATYLALGNRETAFSWLETAYRERNPQLMFLKVDERFSTLRSEPEFRDLLHRVRLL